MADEFDQFKRPAAAAGAASPGGDEFAKYKRPPAAAPSDWDDIKSFGSRMGSDVMDVGKSIGSGLEDIYESHDPLTELSNKSRGIIDSAVGGTYNALDRAEKSGGEAWRAAKRGDYGTALDQLGATAQHEAGMIPYVDPVDRGVDRMIAEKKATGRVNPETAADTAFAGVSTAAPAATRLIPKFISKTAPIARAAGKAVGDVATPENLATVGGGYAGYHLGGGLGGAGGAVAGKAFGRAFGKRLAEGAEHVPPVDEVGFPSFDSEIPDATPPARPVRGLLNAKPIELPSSEAPISSEPEGLLDANRRVVRDPETGRMKVQYLTSPGGKVIREGPVAPAEGIPEAPQAEPAPPEPPPVPKGGIRGVQPPTGYTVEEPTEEELTKDEIAHGRSVDNPIDIAIAAARKNGAQPPTHAQIDATDQRILSSKETRAALEPKGRPGETEPGIPETPAPQNGAATAAPETPAPKRNGRGVQVPLDEWEAGQEIPTNVENTKIPRQTLLKQPNGGTEPLGANQDLTAPLQQSVDQLKGQEGEQRPPFVDPASSTSYGSRNQGVTPEEAAQAKKDLSDKMFRSNAGFDPSMLSDAVKVGLFHLEAGAREFGDWSQKMIAELGNGVKPYLDHLWKKVMQPSIPGLETAAEEQPNAPMFYSKAAKIVDEKVGGKGSGDQILATLRNSGVKEDEIKWMGLDDFLQGKGKVTKPEVQQFIRDNQIQLTETSLGQDARNLVSAVRDTERGVDALHGALARELVRQGVAQLDVANWPWQVREGRLPIESLPSRVARTLGQDLLDQHEKMMQAKEALNDFIGRGGDKAGPPKYEEHTLPGPMHGYTEMLLRLADPPRSPEFLRVQAAREAIAERLQAARAERLNMRSQAESDAIDERIADLNSQFVDLDKDLDRLISPITNPPQRAFETGHFSGVRNILAHVRFDERTGEDGKPMLFLEEVQSDWHQRGKKSGYVPRINFEALDARRQELENLGTKATLAEKQEWADIKNKLARARSSGVPDAPFKTDWHELVMKRILRFAAENGYDRIGWVTGEQTAQRYDLTKHVDRIKYDADTGDFTAYDHRGEQVLEKNVDSQGLEELIGKGLADELQKPDHIKYDEDWEPDPDAYDEETGEYDDHAYDDQPRWHELEGADLKMGGEWAHNLYDKAIPHFLGKYGKKWGAKVEDGTVPGSLEDDGRYEVHEDVHGTFHVTATDDEHGEGGTIGPEFDSKEHAERWLRRQGYLDHQVHTMPITPAMKKSVLKEGQPISENRAAPPHEIPEFAIPA